MPTNNKPDNAATRAGHIERFNIYSHRTGKFADVSAGCVELYYYEEILSNSISATAVIVESGLSNTQIGDDKGNNIVFDIVLKPLSWIDLSFSYMKSQDALTWYSVVSVLYCVGIFSVVLLLFTPSDMTSSILGGAG